MSLSLLFLRGPPWLRRKLLTQRHIVTSQKIRLFSSSIVTTWNLTLQFSPAFTSDTKCILYHLREVFQIEVKYVSITSLCCNCKLDTCQFEVILTVHRRYYVEIKCQLDATDGIYCRFYCMLNMFRAILCPSSGAREYYTDGRCLWYLLLRFSGCRYGVELKTKAPNTTGSDHLYNTLELLMMGIVLPETCWACNKICNKYHLLHLVGILFPRGYLSLRVHCEDIDMIYVVQDTPLVGQPFLPIPPSLFKPLSLSMHHDVRVSGV